MTRIITLEGTFNTRDIGGILNKEGKCICYNRMIRSDALNKIKKMHTQEEIAEYLHENYGISERGVDNVFESYMEKGSWCKWLCYLQVDSSKGTIYKNSSYIR